MESAVAPPARVSPPGASRLLLGPSRVILEDSRAPAAGVTVEDAPRARSRRTG